MPVINEILERSVQGKTEPFLCGADDGRRYYVKGRNATQRGLCAEFVAGTLGREYFGLPVPEFQLLEVPKELIQYSNVPDVRNLDVGMVFGSCIVKDVMEFGPTHRDRVSPELAAKILLFDLWIRNDDRKMSGDGGNSNLLWQPEGKKLWVFDHNLAFDNTVLDINLLGQHAFGTLDSARKFLSDPVFRAEAEQQMAAGLAALPDLLKRIPPEWYYLDAEQTIGVDLRLDEVRQILERPLVARDTFWRGLAI
jgi:hypothetical protein